MFIYLILFFLVYHSQSIFKNLTNMDQEKQSVFISDGLRIADFIRFLFKIKCYSFFYLYPYQRRIFIYN